MSALASPGAARAPRGGMPAAVRALAAELLPRAPELAQGMTDHLVANIDELPAGDDELREETRASVQGNVDQVLRLLKLGAGADALVVPPDAAEYVRGLVRRGITLAVLLRTYRLGHAWFWDVWCEELTQRVTDAAELLVAQEQSSAFLFAYIDGISGVLVDAYGTERERLMRGAAQVRAETVRAILAGDAVDEEVADQRLGYALRRHHVALRLSGGAAAVRGLERAATDAAALLGPGAPLVVLSGAASLDVWCGAFETPSVERLEDYRPPAGIRVAFGAPAHGVAGFRSSHAEAVQAARIASLAPAAAGPVTGYQGVELMSLLATDLPRARAFVLRQLGALAAPDDAAERLRETVLAFLASGGRGTRAAKQLHVHQNTVAYRVKRAEELLGRRVSERPIELTCALTLAAALGPAVLAAA
ncbi:MAG TPA: helix-turn-helix domain-containing protein [Baekduia sp.]